MAVCGAQSRKSCCWCSYSVGLSPLLSAPMPDRRDDEARQIVRLSCIMEDRSARWAKVRSSIQELLTSAASSTELPGSPPREILRRLALLAVVCSLERNLWRVNKRLIASGLQATSCFPTAKKLVYVCQAHTPATDPSHQSRHGAFDTAKAELAHCFLLPEQQHGGVEHQQDRRTDSSQEAERASGMPFRTRSFMFPSPIATIGLGTRSSLSRGRTSMPTLLLAVRKVKIPRIRVSRPFRARC